MPPAKEETLVVNGRSVSISNPSKVYFPRLGLTKLDLVHYFLSVADGAVRAVHGRPMALKRYPNGVDGPFFYQKRVPPNHPEWIETVELRYPSGGVASEIVVREPAQLIWVANLGCLDLHPHLVRADDLEHPDELRIDLDPVRGVGWSQIRDVALLMREILNDVGLIGWPKTSGSRGFHIYCRIERRWTFAEVRRAAAGLAREAERRAPGIATSRWWKEERTGVFVDYNQNAKDHTVVSAYSVRPNADGRVSTPLAWDEVPSCEPGELTIQTVPRRFASIGDPWAAMDSSVGSIEALLELARDNDMGDEEPPPAAGQGSRSGRRQSKMPLVEIARAKTEAEAMVGLERWKERYPNVWARIEPADVLIDSMRGSSTTWSRIRLNLQHVPEPERPPQGPLEVDYDPWAELRERPR
jgi:bifunctional non-homologous end joining protein LigD